MIYIESSVRTSAIKSKRLSENVMLKSHTSLSYDDFETKSKHHSYKQDYSK